MTVHHDWGHRRTRLLSRIVWAALLVVVAATPLIVDPRGRDLFRVPKTAFFQAGMLVVGALAAAAALLSEPFAAMLARRRRAVILACAAVAWVAIVSMLSTMPALSRGAPFTIFCHALLFVLTVALARTGGALPALGVLLLPAAFNAGVVVLQAFDIWQPMGIGREGSDRYGNVGLIGNANTAGTYLVVPAIAALAAAVAMRRHRALFGAITIVLLVGIFQTQTITVIFGLTVALLAYVVTGSKRVRILAVAVVAAGILGLLLYTPTRTRLMTLKESLNRRDFRALTSNRVPAAFATLDMFLDRPLVGLGPGAFAARYMQYRMAVEERHPDWIQPTRENFGEAHNDHLQVLAETGVPGYALLAIALISIASLAFRKPEPDDGRDRFVRLFALPAAAGFGAVALGQFPLELTAVSSTSVYTAGLCFAWARRPDDGQVASAAPQAAGRPYARRIAAAAVATVAVAAAALALVRGPWTTQSCNIEKRRAEDLIESAPSIVSDFDRQRAASGAAERMERCIAATPSDWQVHFLAGVLHELAGRGPRAMARYRAALALEERPEIYTAMSILQFQNGQAEEGLRNAEKATGFNLEFAEAYEPRLREQLWAKAREREQRLKGELR